MIKKLITKIKTNSLLKNSLILIALSMIVKVLSLINRIILTRILGTDGISLYVLVIPTIMLFTSLGSFSLNIAMSKLVSQNEATREFKLTSILKKGALISIIASLISIFVVLIILKQLSLNFLKNENTYYPILVSIIFIPISSLNNMIKGVYNGLNKINISSVSSLIEEILRIIAFIIIFIFFPIDNIVIGVNYAILAMIIGEASSLIYQIILLRKYLVNKSNKSIPSKHIISNSLPTLSSRMLGNFTYFLEPIVYTSILIKLGYLNEDITNEYGIINAYIIPIITICSFFSMAIATSILPNISKNYALGKLNLVRYYTKKSIIICLIPGILITILLKFYCEEYMMLIYGVTSGYESIKKFSFFFQFMYLSSPIIAIIQAIGKSKNYFFISTFFSIIKIIMIVVLSLIPSINFDSLILSTLITSILSTLVYYFFLKNILNFKFKFMTLGKIIFINLILYLFAYILKSLNINYIISSGLISGFFLVIIRLTNILILDDE